LTPALAEQMGDFKYHFEDWLTWCKGIKRRFDVKEADYPLDSNALNAYHFVPALIDSCPADTVIVCGNATACIVPFQTAQIRDGMRLFSNSGSASMGYDLPAAIGASLAGAANVLCFAGDGSIMMNIQELQTLQHLNLNIKLVILDNGGYLSIKQTQENFFSARFGADHDSGVSFPNFEKIANAFNLRTISLGIETWRAEIGNIFTVKGPQVIIVKLDPKQEFEPRLKSRMIDGSILTPELDDMFPFLDTEQIVEFRESPLNVTRRELNSGS
jgi:acetolactate synthase-1/2/3 large subunit